MGHKFAEIAFTDEVKKVQEENNSRGGYATMAFGDDYNQSLSLAEAKFIQQRDTCYMASVSETNWPYVQHRGGPKGFMHVVDSDTIAFADFTGNRQYVSTGNFRTNDRVSLIFMDYPNKRRLKILGNITEIPQGSEILSQLENKEYGARIERGFIIKVAGFDWNCPKYITPRYTEEEVETFVAPIIEQVKHLEEQLASKTVKDDQKPTNSSNIPQPFGSGELKLVISGIRQLTPRVRAYEFRSVDNSPLPKVIAGSHLQIPVLLNNNEIDHRNYSICSNPSRRDIYEIAVLNEPEGSGGSKMIHEHFGLGMEIHCPIASNHFEHHSDDRPTVLIAAGIGITPIKAMSQSLTAQGSQISFHYAGRSRRQMAYLDRLEREFTDRLSVYSADEGQRLNLKNIFENTSKNTVFYLCGPNKLIDDAIETAQQLNIDPSRIRFERFATKQNENATEIQVKLKKSNRSITVASNETVLDALLDAGVSASYSCKTGECRTCAVKVISGEVEHLDTALTDFDKNEQKLMCPCVSRAHSKQIILDI